MSVAMIGPKFYAWDRNGKPLAFGKLYTYQASTNTPKPTYQSEDQVVENTNPVILNGEGYANVYLDGSYKMVLKDDKDNEIWTSDPVTSAQAEEWVNCLPASYVNGTTFKVNGNFTDKYDKGRKVRVNNGISVYSYSTVVSSSYAADETTVILKDSVVSTGIVDVCSSVVSSNSSFNNNDVGLASAYQSKNISDMISGVLVGGSSVDHKVGQIWRTKRAFFECKSNSPTSINDFYILSPVSALDYGAEGDGVNNDHASVQNAFSSDFDVKENNSSFKIESQLVLQSIKDVTLSTANVTYETDSLFTGSIFRVAPQPGTDPKGMSISGLRVKNNGNASNVMNIDLSQAGSYLSKFVLEKCISDNPVNGYFVELVNSIPNIDGLFTSVFRDNWSFNGYYLNNIGDSIQFKRNTITGNGYGFYVNQLGTAANIKIESNNITVDSNSLFCVKGANITFHDNQVEVTAAFTGQGDSSVYIDHTGVGAGLVFNTKITSNNINTKGNVSNCIRLQETDLAFIEGNQLYCDPATGAHIVIDSGARNTVIGKNKYFSSVDSTEIEPIIVDNGVGTFNLWKDATISLSGWNSQGTSTENPLGFYKNSNGTISIRGRVAGPASSVNDVLFNLPVGYRPLGKGSSVNVGSATLFFDVTGNVFFTSSGDTLVNFNGLTVSL